MSVQGSSYSPFARALIMAAAVIVVIAGLKLSAPIMVPFLLSIFIAVMCLPPITFMRDRGLPFGIALIVVITGMIVVSLLLGWLVGSSIEDFYQNLPGYQQRISGQWVGALGWIQSLGFTLPEQFAGDTFDPRSAMKLVASVLQSFGNVLANSFLILLTVIFILTEAASFNRKLERIGWAHDHSDAYVKRLRLYMSIKTTMSVLTGALVAGLLWVLGVDHAALWGVVAFMFNFIPNIGSIIAAVPAVLLAMVQIDVTTAMLVAAGYVAINIGVGSVLEPRYMGKELGLSTLVVFLSLVFWGWILGPVGMLLSVPLTVSVKLALDANEETRWAGQLLGNVD